MSSNHVSPLKASTELENNLAYFKEAVTSLILLIICNGDYYVYLI